MVPAGRPVCGGGPRRSGLVTGSTARRRAASTQLPVPVIATHCPDEGRRGSARQVSSEAGSKTVAGLTAAPDRPTVHCTQLLLATPKSSADPKLIDLQTTLVGSTSSGGFIIGGWLPLSYRAAAAEDVSRPPADQSLLLWRTSASA